ncbi:MAG: hypothetical protein KAS80_00485 [Anaerolineales bacterium]|nr:hypothetical protein [Anaerolineales bacterium]
MSGYDSTEDGERFLAGFTFSGIERIMLSASRAHEFTVYNAGAAMLAFIGGWSAFDQLFF